MSGAALRMALASVGASTPFITNTPSSAVTLPFAEAGVRLGLAGVGVGSAEAALVVVSFAGFAPLLSAAAGATAMANRSRLDNNLVNVNMDGVLSFRPRLGLCTKHGAKKYSKWMNDVKQEFE